MTRSMFFYTSDGNREPFDPRRLSKQLEGCVLCGRRIIAVGSFLPTTPVMRAVVMRLRQHAVPEGSTPSLSYGLCARHYGRTDTPDRVEQALVDAARKVKVQ